MGPAEAPAERSSVRQGSLWRRPAAPGRSRVAAPPRAPGPSGRARLRPGREAPFDQQRPGRAGINGAVAPSAASLRPGLPQPPPLSGPAAWASVGPARRSGGEPPASTRLRSGRRPPAPRGSPAPAPPARRPPAPRVRAALRRPARRRLRARPAGLAESAPTNIWFPSSLAAVILNRQQPGAYIYRATRVLEAAVGTIWLPLGEFLSFGGAVPILICFSFWKLGASDRDRRNLQTPREGHIVFASLLSVALQSRASRPRTPLGGPPSL